MREETARVADEMVPELLAHCKRLEVLFENIDRLERMVHVVRTNVDDVERDVVALEKAQTMQPIKTMIKSFASTFLRKKQPSIAEAPTNSAPYKAPAVFATEAFFPAEHSTL